jgi:AhpC/TSA family
MTLHPAWQRTVGVRVTGLALAMILWALGPASAAAIEVGQPAPDFKLASTFGNDISLRDFRGKKWVLIEFYGADFAPT